ncbi:MAG: ATP-dependent sacrificial sulfur transferase LarE [Gemmatimonadota bacterium]|nr:MAG: ATP-dependent sacrificial sulfur transferase LarE [Gemmatimonadota bacterium]
MPGSSKLERIISDYASVLVGYSGGVDSTLVAVVARRILGRDRSLAAIGVSPSLAREQYDQARDVAAQFDLNLIEVATNELDDPRYAANPRNRCYFCKHELWSKLSALALQRNLAVVADGTNADDLNEHRPGLDAAREFVIRSPLSEAGYTKDDVRREARSLGIPQWDAPAAPCLSSRVLYGLDVNPQRLSQVEQGEAFIREIGVTGDLRVRHRGDEARIEVAPSQFAAIRSKREAIVARFTDLGFAKVTLDLAGYRRGSLLSELESQLEYLVGEG